MISLKIVALVSLIYFGILFGVAYFADRQRERGRSMIDNPSVYSLSLAVYCTSWTFYGSVGLAARSGLDFLPTYIGPTLMALLGWSVWQKIIRISKVHRITSIADFIASRYGKSTTLGGLATNIAVIGVIPYIALQLKAISTGFLLITQYPRVSVSFSFSDVSFVYDPAFYIALLLAVFAILFGTRHLDATERHEGLVAAIEV